MVINKIELVAAKAEQAAADFEESVGRKIDARIERHFGKTEPNPLSIPKVKNLTDLGNAERMAEQFGDLLHYSDTHKWYFWDKCLWNPSAEAKLNQWAAHTVKGIYTDATKTDDKQERARISVHAMKSESTHAIKNMLDLLRYQEGIRILEDAFDADPWLLNVLNGTIDLRTGKLHGHCKKDLITKLAPVVYDPDAKSDLWDGFLRDVTGGDKDLERFLQCAAGYSLCGDYRNEVFFFVYGPTASGKSTFVDSIMALLGSYAVTADINTFLKSKHNAQGPRPDLARLARTRMVVTSEIEEGSKLATGFVKNYTGGDVMTARPLYKEHFEFKSRGKLWFVANYAPRVSADDGAIWRRVRRVPFENSVPTDRQNLELKQVLCDPKISGPAILTWAVQGFLDYRENGLIIPEAVNRSTAEYREEMNPVADFIKECCEVNLNNPDFVETSGDLWRQYQEWAGENGIRMPMTQTELGKNLPLFGLKPKRLGGDRIRGWQGIRICKESRTA